MRPSRTILAVGLETEAGAALRSWVAADAVGNLTEVADAHDAREWLDAATERPLVVIARFGEADAWGLSSLFSRLRRVQPAVPVILVSDVPRASLPVLLTDTPGLSTVVLGDEDALVAAVRDRVFSGSSRALA